MIPAIIPQRLLVAGLLTALPLYSGFREDIGFPELQAEFSSSLPNGSALKIAHIEYVRDGTWAPEAVDELQGKSISYLPGIPASFSYHGDEVGRVFYGSTSSIIPAVSQIKAFEAWNYFDYSLNTGKGIAPAVGDWDVENHSYISNSGLTVNEGGRRLDYRIDKDGMTATVVLENGTGSIPPLFGNTYNTIVVGSSTGSHSRGGTNRDTTGRIKPDIVGTATWTSYAGPIVGSAAGLLIAKAKTDSNLTSARRPEVVKAMLMAGATKDEFPSWSRTASAPIDAVYGAGEVNILNSYRILVAGRQQASPSTVRSNRGWDLNSVGTGSSLRYFFTVAAGQSGTLSAVLTWHRRVEPNNGAWNQGVTASVDNLDLRVYRANSDFQLGDLLQDSVSTLDNVEHVYLKNLTEGTYALVVTSVSGSKQFGLAWTVLGATPGGEPPPPGAIAPEITSQPTSRTITQGSSTTFNVSTTGTAPLSYQWKKNGAAINGATASSFSIASAALSDAGTYSVTVSNSAGSATSNGAYLTVNQATSAPVITSQPSAAIVNEGGSATFSVSANGTAPFSYQWKKDGVSIAGATSSSLTISPASASDAGSYTVAISNSAGSALSNAAFLTVNSGAVAPSISSQPTPRTVAQGSSTTFTVSASGTGPLAYQWKKDGVSISGATSASFTISSASVSDKGTYSVTVTNSAGSVTSSGAYLTVNQVITAPVITTQPAAAAVNEGGSATFSVDVDGTSPFSYQWKKDGVSLTGATSSLLTINPASVAHAGTYSVTITNSAGTANSSGAHLTVSQSVTAPVITSQPAAATAIEGGSATFSVGVDGTSPFTYQWKKDGISIAGATSSSLTINPVSAAHTGDYTVSISNSAGSTVSNAASLTISSVAIAPSITSQPSPRTVAQGASTTLSVVATGTGPLAYQWKKDGIAIGGATSSSFTISSAAVSDAGTYSVSVTNSAGSVASNAAFVTVSASSSAPSITSQPVPASALEGGSATFSVIANGSAPFSYQWRKDGAPISGATAASYTLSGAKQSDAGYYSVVISNSAGSVTSGNALLSVSQQLAAPVIAIQPNPASVSKGSSVLFSVTASGSNPMTYQWRKNGSPIAGATVSTFSIASTAETDSASYSVVVTNPAGSATSSDAALTVSSVAQVSPGGRLANISSRSKVSTGSAVVISGFVVTGKQAKTLLIRAAGPSLAGLGVDGSLQRPKLGIYSGSTLIQEVGAGGRFPTVGEARSSSVVAGAFAFPDSSTDVAIVRSFQPGAYTVHLTGENDTTGIALIEVYDLDASTAESRIVNLSTRAEVRHGGEILITGVYVSGTSPKQVLMRAVGPGLTELGVPGALAKPKISLYQGSSVVAENTGWTSAANAGEITMVSSRVGALGLKETNADSALLVTLAPGAYTLHISGADGGTGIVLADVFEVP